MDFIEYMIDWGLGIGDWGLWIGDWANPQIPNPQSPIPNPHFILKFKFNHNLLIILKFFSIINFILISLINIK